MNTTIDNMQKYTNYREQMGRLNKAIRNGFFLEAIFIEYAILEDRIESVLRHSGKFNPDRHRTLNSKLRRMEEMQRAKKELLRKYISDELIASITEWKEERNRLIHALMKQNLHTEEISLCKTK